MAALARRTLSRLARRAVGTALESRVTEPATPARGDHLSLPHFGQVADDFTGIDIPDDRAAWNLHVQIIARLACLVATGTGLSAFRTELPRHTKIGERIHGRVCDHVNTAAVTAIAAVGSALFNVFFTAKTQAAVPAIACLYADCRFIDEFHCLSLQKTPRAAGFFSSQERHMGTKRCSLPKASYRGHGPLLLVFSWLTHSRTGDSSNPFART